MEYYTVLYCSEDGGHSLEVLDKARLEEKLNESYWGDCEVRVITPNQHIDLSSCAGLFIIKGVPVQPKAEEKVTKWAL